MKKKKNKKNEFLKDNIKLSRRVYKTVQSKDVFIFKSTYMKKLHI